MTILIQATRVLLLTGLTVLPVACSQPIPTTIIDPRSDRSAIDMGLDMRDFEGAAAKVVQDMLESGAVDHPGAAATRSFLRLFCCQVCNGAEVGLWSNPLGHDSAMGGPLRITSNGPEARHLTPPL
jgi:hypothetical protein